jgi:hypothetical protein
LVARVVLGGFYVTAMLAAIVLGIGVNPAFSDGALRRYPLSAVQRLAARQLTAFLEPLWMFILALDLGLAAGFHVLGVASLWLGFPAAVLLVLTNYLLARVLLSLVERLMSTRTRPLYLLLAILLVSFTPALLGPVLGHNRAFLSAAVAVLKLTPPFAGAAVMAGATALSSFYWLLLLLGWCLGLATVLAAIERLPIPSRAVAGGQIVWDGPWDRLAALFGSTWSPLIAKTLRYHLRNIGVRINYLIIVPLLSFMVVMHSGRRGAMAVFLSALCLISVVGFAGTAGVSVNAFGYDGPGFRRYFLMPVPAGTVLRATSLVSLLLGAALIPVALLVWLIFAPVPTDARMIVMLLSSALGGLFVFHALSVWTTLLAPRQSDLTKFFGNYLSFAANVVMMGGFFGAMALSMVLRHLVSGETVLGYWWAAPPLVLAAAAFYLFSLRAGAAVFVTRRERMQPVVEGRT